MKLVELDIRRLPGITAPFRLAADEIGTHVTLIHGPNGVGKSSVLRALTALLWPELELSRAVDLNARFEADGRSYSVERHADHVAWRVDGDPAPAPVLPPSHLASCYAITGDELFGGGDVPTLATKDGDLAAEIARQMSGGFDLQKLRSELGQNSRAPQIAATQLRNAKSSLSQVQDAHKKLDVERAELTSLREREMRALGAAQCIADLETALQLDTARAVLRAHEEALGAFASGMAELRGNELKRLGEIEAKLSAERRTIEDADHEIERCHASIRSAALPEHGIPAGKLAELRQRVDRIHRIETELGRLEREEAIAREGLEARRRSLHPIAAPRVDAASLARAEELVRRAELLQQRAAALAAEHAMAVGESEALDDARVVGDARRSVEAMRLLTEWLSTPDAQSRAHTPELWMLIAAVTIATILLGVWVHPGWYALLAVAAIALVRVVRSRGVVKDRREYESTYARLGIATPEHWTHEAVRARLAELGADMVAIERASQNAARADVLARRRAHVDEQIETANGERRRIAEELGLDVATSDLALSILSRNVLEFVRAGVDHAKSEAGVSSQQAAREAELAPLVQDVRGFGIECGSGSAAFTGALTALARRAEDHSGARSKLDLATAQRARSAQRVEELEVERAELLSAAGDERELARRIDALPKWKAAASAVEDAQREERMLRHRLREAPQHVESPRALLERQLEEARRTAAERDECIRRIQHIETSIQAMEQQHGLEQALADVDVAKDALRERREDALDDAASAWLLDSVESAAQQTAHSPVFKRAAAAFARFTNHAYELQISAGRAGEPPAFRALDTARGDRLALHELSSGTRAQLLLAARVGFVAGPEHGETLPLLLDEALATTDSERFAAIARSLSIWAREDERQVLYLTSDASHAQQWQAAAPDADVSVVDLALVRRIAGGAGVLTPPRPVARAIPDPSGMSSEQYAQALHVPAIDAFADADNLHLYYVLRDDLTLLRRLLELRIESVGSLRSLARSSESSAYVAAEDVARIEAWAAIYDAILQAWRIGRCRPVGRDVLQAAGVSEKYVADVAAILSEVDGDPRRLVEKLTARADERLKGWRDQKTAQLETYLHERSYLDSRDPLSSADIVGRALTSGAPAVRAGMLEQRAIVDRTIWVCALLEQSSARAVGARALHPSS